MKSAQPAPALVPFSKYYKESISKQYIEKLKSQQEVTKKRSSSIKGSTPKIHLKADLDDRESDIDSKPSGQFMKFVTSNRQIEVRKRKPDGDFKKDPIVDEILETNKFRETKEFINSVRFENYTMLEDSKLTQPLKKVISKFEILHFLLSVLQAGCGISSVILLGKSLEFYGQEKSSIFYSQVFFGVGSGICLLARGLVLSIRDSILYKIRRKVGHLSKNLYFFKLLKINKIYFRLFNTLFVHSAAWNNCKAIQSYYESVVQLKSAPIITMMYVGFFIYYFGLMHGIIIIGAIALSESLIYGWEMMTVGSIKRRGKADIKKLKALDEFISQIFDIKANSMQNYFIDKMKSLNEREEMSTNSYLRRQSLRTTFSKIQPFIVSFILNGFLLFFHKDLLAIVEEAVLIAMIWDFQRIKWRYYEWFRTKGKMRKAIIFFKNLLLQIEDIEEDTYELPSLSDDSEKIEDGVGVIDVVNLDIGLPSIDECRDKISLLIEVNFLNERLGLQEHLIEADQTAENKKIIPSKTSLSSQVQIEVPKKRST